MAGELIDLQRVRARRRDPSLKLAQVRRRLTRLSDEDVRSVELLLDRLEAQTASASAVAAVGSLSPYSSSNT